MNRLDLKVDAIVIGPRLAAGDRRLILVYNINIPAYLSHEERTVAVARAQALLESDFRNTDVQYQVTASYFLRHTHTDFERFWNGSFYARGNSPAQLSGFERFNSLTFATNVQRAMRDAERKLTYTGLDTVWKFDRLNSIILNVQSKIRANHPVFGKRGLHDIMGRKLQISFALP
jgi:hypothetical protein